MNGLARKRQKRTTTCFEDPPQKKQSTAKAKHNHIQKQRVVAEAAAQPRFCAELSPRSDATLAVLSSTGMRHHECLEECRERVSRVLRVAKEF